MSSYYVSDEALKRACFILRFLYADRADLRESMYKNFGRFGVIGVNEGIQMITCLYFKLTKEKNA